jgi:hypothetical protein
MFRLLLIVGGACPLELTAWLALRQRPLVLLPLRS